MGKVNISLSNIFMHFEWGKILNYNSCNLKPFDTQDTHARNSQKVVFEESTTSNRTKRQEKNCDTKMLLRVAYIDTNTQTDGPVTPPCVCSIPRYIFVYLYIHICRNTYE